MGVRLAIDTDAHAPGHLAYQEFGLVTARRGWVQPSDVINTRPWESLAELRRDRFRTRGWSLAGLAGTDGDELETTREVEVEHWPEVDPAPPRDDTDLEARLRARPLDGPLRERVEAWLRTADDPKLEAALAALGDNPLQTAFNLLVAMPGPTGP
jgi:hypothetical protein